MEGADLGRNGPGKPDRTGTGIGNQALAPRPTGTATFRLDGTSVPLGNVGAVSATADSPAATVGEVAPRRHVRKTSVWMATVRRISVWMTTRRTGFGPDDNRYGFGRNGATASVMASWRVSAHQSSSR